MFPICEKPFKEGEKSVQSKADLKSEGSRQDVQMPPDRALESGKWRGNGVKQHRPGTQGPCELLCSGYRLSLLLCEMVAINVLRPRKVATKLSWIVAGEPIPQ